MKENFTPDWISLLDDQPLKISKKYTGKALAKIYKLIVQKSFIYFHSYNIYLSIEPLDFELRLHHYGVL